MGSNLLQDVSAKSPTSWPSADLVASLSSLKDSTGAPFNATSQVMPGMYACIAGLNTRHELNGVTVKILHNMEDADGAENRWMVALDDGSELELAVRLANLLPIPPRQCLLLANASLPTPSPFQCLFVADTSLLTPLSC